MRYYDRNLIISVITGTPLTLLALSCAIKGQQTDTIELSADAHGQLNPLSEEDISKIQQLTGNSRLYIFGHCNKGIDILGDNKTLVVSYQEIASIITMHVDRTSISGLRISLFGCYAASSSSPDLNDSFAAKLHQQLAFNGLKNIDLTAYRDAKAIAMNSTTNVIIKYSKADLPIIAALTQRKREALLESKHRHLKLSELIKRNNHNRAFLKILFTWNGSMQQQIDYYQEKRWEEKTISSLEKLNFVAAHGFRQQRTYLDRLSFLNRAKKYIDSDTHPQEKQQQRYR